MTILFSIFFSLIKGISIEMSRQLMHIALQFNLINKFWSKLDADIEYITFILIE